jgi:hypothetical protein
VSLFAGFRYLNISTDRSYGLSRYELQHYEVPVGLRYSFPILPGIKIFGEGHLSWAMLRIDHPEFAGNASPSGSGVGLRAGFAALLADQLGLGVAVGYSHATIEVFSSSLGMRFGGEDRKLGDAWLTIEVSAHIGF